jgi:hypothetical protein
MAKTTFTAEQKTILADLKKREKRDVYGEITLDVPYSVFGEYISNMVYCLQEQDLEKTAEELMVIPEVREHFESELQNLTLDDLTSCYGIEIDCEEFASMHFAEEIDAAIAEQERLEEEERKHEQEEEARIDAELRAKMQQINVTGENYTKAVAVLRAAGLI